MEMNRIVKKVGIAGVILFLVLPIVPVVNGVQDPPTGFILALRGGIGRVRAMVDTYYSGGCFESVPVNCHLQVVGKYIISDGHTDVIFPGLTRGWVKSGAVFGFGPATIVCRVETEAKTRPVFVIGFLVIGL